ncbi:unnamed protein product [Vitrella brassicaformis CCMP3155]|uniref:Leucine-rich repeat-containing N-terminal plant-type domain-containing protein n=1 Tax=Vitrella brassicaformis (strain CCMP3155) TaxID=1169540 RepID=A0A0G4H2J1_VITBC|nr:unnamed protein product [Vitrella brassicaformis CCMP3155]|eukprot:CEM37694.1 unnamed protein product [Vitrella brassicaformis CCMP3155]
MEDLSTSECGPCQADADALSRLLAKISLVNKTDRSAFAVDFCNASFIVCIRLPDGAEGYLLLLWGNREDGFEVTELRENLRTTVDFPRDIYELKHILGLWISSVPFEGHLMDEVGNMTSLRLLYIRGTIMNGTILKSINNLTSLKALDIIGSSQKSLSFSGQLPNLNLPSLELLGITDAALNGPFSVANLMQIKYLTLEPADLHLGSIPSTLGHNLTSLVLENVSLSGRIPDSLGELHHLKTLDLQRNNLSGPIPMFLRNLTRLRHLRLQSNSLYGSLPDGFGSNWPDLEELELQENQWGNFLQLRELYLEWNKLSGTLDALGLPPQLKKVHLSHNKFNGPVPDGLAECAELKELVADNNNLAALPSSLDEWTSLTTLSLSNNNMTGTLPSLSPIKRLRMVDLSCNRIEGFTGNGSLPETLEDINFDTNALAIIPASWHYLPAAKKLLLSNNSFTASTWPEWFETAKGYCANDRISTLSEAKEWLSAKEPPDWPVLRELDVSFNSLHIDVTDFLQGFRALPSLSNLSCAECQLKGNLTCAVLYHFDRDDGYVTFKDSFKALSATGILTLAFNHITAVDTSGEPLKKMAHDIDLRNNSLERFDVPDSPSDWPSYLNLKNNTNLRLFVNTTMKIKDCAELTAMRDRGIQALVRNPNWPERSVQIASEEETS